MNPKIKYYDGGVPFTILEIGDIIFSKNFTYLKYVIDIKNRLNHQIRFKTILGPEDDGYYYNLLNTNNSQANKYPHLECLQKVKK